MDKNTTGRLAVGITIFSTVLIAGFLIFNIYVSYLNRLLELQLENVDLQIQVLELKVELRKAKMHDEVEFMHL